MKIAPLRLGFAAGAVLLLAAWVTPTAAADIEGAKTNFQTFCVKCHGKEGKGDGQSAATLKTKPRDFTDCARMGTLSDDLLFKVIKNGGAANSLSGDMPAWSQGLEDDEIHSL